MKKKLPFFLHTQTAGETSHDALEYAGNLAAGSHRLSLSSTEGGLHRVYIYMDNVLYESIEIEFL